MSHRPLKRIGIVKEEMIMWTVMTNDENLKMSIRRKLFSKRRIDPVDDESQSPKSCPRSPTKAVDSDLGHVTPAKSPSHNQAFVAEIATSDTRLGDRGALRTRENLDGGGPTKEIGAHVIDGPAIRLENATNFPNNLSTSSEKNLRTAAGSLKDITQSGDLREHSAPGISTPCNLSIETAPDPSDTSFSDQAALRARENLDGGGPTKEIDAHVIDGPTIRLENATNFPKNLSTSPEKNLKTAVVSPKGSEDTIKSSDLREHSTPGISTTCNLSIETAPDPSDTSVNEPDRYPLGLSENLDQGPSVDIVFDDKELCADEDKNPISREGLDVVVQNPKTSTRYISAETEFHKSSKKFKIPRKECLVRKEDPRRKEKFASSETAPLNLKRQNEYWEDKSRIRKQYTYPLKCRRLAARQKNFYLQWMDDLNLETADFEGYHIPKINLETRHPSKTSVPIRVQQFNPLKLSPDPKLVWGSTKLTQESKIRTYAPSRSSRLQELNSNRPIESKQQFIIPYPKSQTPNSDFRDLVSGRVTPIYVNSPVKCNELDPDDQDVLIITIADDDFLPLPLPTLS